MALSERCHTLIYDFLTTNDSFLRVFRVPLRIERSSRGMNLDEFLRFVACYEPIQKIVLSIDPSISISSIPPCINPEVTKLNLLRTSDTLNTTKPQRSDLILSTEFLNNIDYRSCTAAQIVKGIQIVTARIALRRNRIYNINVVPSERTFTNHSIQSYGDLELHKMKEFTETAKRNQENKIRNRGSHTATQYSLYCDASVCLRCMRNSYSISQYADEYGDQKYCMCFYEINSIS